MHKYGQKSQSVPISRGIAVATKEPPLPPHGACHLIFLRRTIAIPALEQYKESNVYRLTELNEASLSGILRQDDSHANPVSVSPKARTALSDAEK